MNLSDSNKRMLIIAYFAIMGFCLVFSVFIIILKGLLHTIYERLVGNEFSRKVIDTLCRIFN